MDIERFMQGLPRMVLDEVVQTRFAAGLCAQCSIWGHSVPMPQQGRAT
jgi:hypothetical protein